MKKTACAFLTVLYCLYTGAILAADVASAVTVEQAGARAVAPGVPVSAAYMTIRNDADTDHALVAAHSEVARSVEMHSHDHVDGMMQMRRLDSVPLPASTPVTFEPGGLHIMLIGLLQPIRAGDVIAIEFEFEDGSRKPVEFAVE